MNNLHKDESTNAMHRGGMTRKSDEASVMEVEQRGHINSVCEEGQPEGRKPHEQTKPFQISMIVVKAAYERVKANRGAAGVDKESIKDFEKNLDDNLYKIWNRMSSGTYFPPAVKMVEIPKKTGGKRALGIPTVSDRIAQMVVKLYIEPGIDPIFHKDSYGYRPGKSAIQAVGVTRQRCWKYDWLLEFDIKGLFDNIDHELLMRAVRKHVKRKWAILYIERWLKASFMKPDGTLEFREKGTPQGGVISPLLANLFLHYAFDFWMTKNFPDNPFARYADDGVVHCGSKKEAEMIREALDRRFKECHLEMHPEKTRIVNCKIDRTKDHTEHRKFDFLGFTFRARGAKNKYGKIFVSFLPGMSNNASKSARQKIRGWNIPKRTDLFLKDIAKKFSPVIRGWMNYYGNFYKTELYSIYRAMNHKLVIWAMRKYRRFRKNYYKTLYWLDGIARMVPELFPHWKSGYFPAMVN